jgi:hypothetical protein
MNMPLEAVVTMPQVFSQHVENTPPTGCPECNYLGGTHVLTFNGDGIPGSTTIGCTYLAGGNMCGSRYYGWSIQLQLVTQFTNWTVQLWASYRFQMDVDSHDSGFYVWQYVLPVNDCAHLVGDHTLLPHASAVDAANQGVCKALYQPSATTNFPNATVTF